MRGNTPSAGPRMGFSARTATRVRNAVRDTGTMQPRKIVLLGSTGSIGTQAIDVVDGAPHHFEVVALSAGGGNLELLARQAVHTRALAIGVASGDPGALQVLIDDAAGAA